MSDSEENNVELEEKNTEHEVPPEQAGAPEKKQLRVPLFITVISVLVAAILTAQITFLTVRQSYHRQLAQIEQSRFADSKLTQVDQLYRKYYINGIDEKALTDGLIRGFIYGAGDKYGSYMSAEEKQAAVVLSRSLHKAKATYEAGEHSAEALKAVTREELSQEPLANVDYVDLYTYPALQKADTVTEPCLLAIAVYIGKTRLIDNVILG